MILSYCFNLQVLYWKSAINAPGPLKSEFHGDPARCPRRVTGNLLKKFSNFGKVFDMNKENSTIETDPTRLEILAKIANERNQAYGRGYFDGNECLVELNLPRFPVDIIAYVQGFIQGTYDRVHYNAGDYLTF